MCTLKQNEVKCALLGAIEWRLCDFSVSLWVQPKKKSRKMWDIGKKQVSLQMNCGARKGARLGHLPGNLHNM